MRCFIVAWRVFYYVDIFFGFVILNVMIKIPFNINKFYLIGFVILSLFIVFNFNFALAQERCSYDGGIKNCITIGNGTDSTVTTGGGGLTNPLKTTDLFGIIQNIISYLIKIGAGILAIMVIYGGFLILTAQDSPEKVKAGKNVILYGVIGYTIIISSWGVIYIISEVLTGDTKTLFK